MKNTSRKILVTGATSFLGKHLSLKLKERGEDFFGTAAHEDKKQSIRKMDLLDVKEVKNVVKEISPSFVYHLAALVNLTRDFKIAQQCMEINLKGTMNLLESFRAVTPDVVVFVSTEEVYGNGPIPYIEDQLPYPPSGYAISKMAGEWFCRMYAQELGFKLIILRIGTMYGPGDRTSRFIPQLIIKALENDYILLNSGKRKRDYIYIDDAVQSLINVLNVKNLKTPVVFNIGGGSSYTLLELAKIILRETGSSSNIITGKIPERVGEAHEWLMDIKKADDILGWKPKVSLEKGLRKTIKHYIETVK